MIDQNDCTLGLICPSALIPYDALRSKRPYKEAYSHEKALVVLTKDDRSGIHGPDWYGDKIWQLFDKHHLRIKEVFERKQY